MTAAADNAPLFLGVDGGGTGCRARIEGHDGRVLGRGMAGPATTRIGIAAAWAAIETAWRAAFAEAGLQRADLGRIHAGLGIAGMTREGAPEAFRALDHPFASIRFASDAETACLGAHNGGDGGIVIVGTGSCGMACLGDARVKIGGWGFPVSDEGSGADLGLRAVRMALCAHDGRALRTAFCAEVMRRFEDRPEKVVAWMDRANASDYAALAPLVVRHADTGDAGARSLMQQAAARIDGLCRALLERGAGRLALLGGLGSVMENWLAPDLRRRIVRPLGDAVDGAAILAGRPPKPLPSDACNDGE